MQVKQTNLQAKSGLTKRAPDVWDSAAFSSIFLASSFSCFQALSTPAHTQVTQTVGGQSQKPNTKPSLIRKFCFIVEFRKPNSVFSGGTFQDKVFGQYFFSKQVFKFSAFCSTAFLLLAKFSFGFIESLKSASRFFGFGFGQRKF